ncbi:MAG: LysR family transcriptional regulator [Pseudoxanthomonas sp.]
MLPFSRFAAYFLELARLGSLRKAAASLHVSASAIDRQVLLAEAELGTALFERLPAGLKPTLAGEMLLADLRRWRKDYAGTLERLDELRGLRRGHVTLAVIEALAEGLLVQALAALAERVPGLTFDIQVAESARVADLVGRAEVDLGLSLDPVEHAGLEVRTLMEVPLGVVVPPGHPLAGEAQLSLSRLVPYRQLVPAAPLIVHASVQAMYARHRIESRQVVTCNNVRLLRSLVRSGVGIGVLGSIDVAGDVADGNLVFVPLLRRQARPLQLGLCVARRRQLSRAAQLVLQEVVAHMQQTST